MIKTKINIFGCGWLGLPLGKHLKANGYHVAGSYRSTEGLERLTRHGIQGFKLHLGNPSQIDFQATPNAEIAIILFTPRVIASDQVNLTQCINNQQYSRVILASSTSVYPNDNGLVTEEDAIHQPSKHSGIDMFALENELNTSLSAPLTIMRLAGLFGPNRDPGNFFADRATVKGGTSPVNMIHLEDCVRGFTALVKSKGSVSTAYNLCSDEHPSREDFYSMAMKKLGRKLPLFDEHPAPYKIVSNKKFKMRFGFEYTFKNPLDALAT